MSESQSSTTSTTGGIGCLGAFIALFLSIKTWGWTWWTLFHFILGWFYVAYWVVFKSGWL